MLDILKAIKKIIDRYIVNMTPLNAGLSKGDTVLSIASTRRYCPGDHVVVYHRPASGQSEGEVHEVTEIIDNQTMTIKEGLTTDFPVTNSFVEKLLGFETGNQQFLEASYIGDPSVVIKFPCITINGTQRTSEWLTLESTSEKYEIEITVYVTAADYESQFELMHYYTKAIENSLFRSLYPLVEPYDKTTLVEDVDPSDTLIRVSNQNLLRCAGWIFLESYDFLRANRIKNDLGNGVYELIRPAGRDFSAGDSIIWPHRHIYNSLPHSTQYGYVNKDGMLKASRISMKLEEEVRRHVNYIDPLTF